MQDKRRLKIEAARPVVAPTTDANAGPQEVEDPKPDEQPEAEQPPVADVKPEEQPETKSEEPQADEPVKQENHSDQELSTESEGEDGNKRARQPVPEDVADKASALQAEEAPVAKAEAAEEVCCPLLSCLQEVCLQNTDMSNV